MESALPNHPRAFGPSVGNRAPRRPARPRTGEPLSAALVLLGALWVMTILAPQWWLASHGLSPLLKLPLILYGVMMVVLVVGVPTQPAWMRNWQWHAPFLLFIVLGALAIPFTVNNGVARESLTQMFLYWLLIVATVALVPSVRRAEQLLLLFALQFVWWGFWGGTSGRVPWHTVWSNFDGFGAMMVGGLGLCHFFSLSSGRGWFRWTMYGSMLLCVFGVVASFARGAFLGAIALFLVIWLRSPRKGRTLATGLAVAVVMTAAAAALHPDTFVAEIRSTFTQGTSEGTGEDRWTLWTAGMIVFSQHPIFGVGPNNFGPYAADHFRYGEVGGMYDNPSRLYDRELHSAYVQFLSERGAVGFAIFLWILWDFWKRNAALRSNAANERWRAQGGRLDLRMIALGLEANLVAFLVTAAVYSLIGSCWLYTVLALNLVLHSLAVRGAAVPGAVAPARGPRLGRVVTPPRVAGAVSAPGGFARLRVPRS